MVLILSALYLLLAALLYFYFTRKDRGEPEPRKALRAACWFGILAVILAGELNALFIPPAVTDVITGQTDAGLSFEVLFKASLMIGLIEESLKFVPLALYIFGKRYFNETTDGVIYFALAGMWFGVIENIIYTLNYGAEVGITRIIVAPFLHAGFSALAGLGLIKFKLTKNPLYVVFGLGLAIFLHGVYNFFLFTQIPVLALAALGIALFVNLGPFRHFRAARRADEKLGLTGRQYP